MRAKEKKDKSDRLIETQIGMSSVHSVDRLESFRFR